LTPAYSFTDYRSQGQTINNAIIDITTPPTEALTPFNVYVALPRAQHLRIEDERLAMMDRETKQWWKEKTREVDHQRAIRLNQPGGFTIAEIRTEHV
ncbi:hypothetical protein EDB19DRAFT_1643082, partial [Suillus lakei]